MTDAKMCPSDASLRALADELVSGWGAVGMRGGTAIIWLLNERAAQAEEVARLRPCEAALRELVECDDIVKQRVDPPKVKGGRWKAAWEAAHAALAGAEGIGNGEATR